MSTPFRERVARVDRVNGREQLVTKDGSRYLIVTPGEKAGRGLSLDLAVIDEAFAHPDMALVGALMPTLAARRSAQMWLLSNAGTYTSGLWRHFTDVGRSSIDDATSPICWLEWCAAEDAAIDDEHAWLEANPTLDLPHGVQRSALQQASLTLDAATFQREHMNVWPDMSTIIGIDPVTWAACRDDYATLSEQITLSIDITPDRHSGAIVAASQLEDQRIALEVLDTSSNIEALITRTVEIARRWDALVLIDRGGPISSIVPLLERADVRMQLLNLVDIVRACGDFHDAVTHGRVAHRGDYRLTDAIASATKRRVGDAWLWSRRAGGDISPLVAATLARWGIAAAQIEAVPSVF